MVEPSAGQCIIDFMLFVDAWPTTWNLKNNCAFENTLGINLDHLGIIWDHLESVWDLLNHSGIILESFWNIVEIVLGLF